jgi:pimeloyl-ACP methyl ester carboxylesterase
MGRSRVTHPGYRRRPGRACRSVDGVALNIGAMSQTVLRPGLDRAPAQGGHLAFAVLAGTTEPVLAIHGISSQRKLWNWLRAAAPDITLVTPDLRGRADSFTVTGESSIARHAYDMLALLDHLGLDTVHVSGMSMGGFVGVQLATRHRDRVSTLTLIDGGFPIPAPPGLTRELLPAVFADRLGRLKHRWASIDEYLQFFVANTAPMLDPADPLLRDNLAHDLADGLVRLSPMPCSATTRTCTSGRTIGASSICPSDSPTPSGASARGRRPGIPRRPWRSTAPPPLSPATWRNLTMPARS